MDNRIGSSALSLLANRIDRARDVSVFRPDNAQKAARSRFWTHYIVTDTPTPQEVDLALATRLCGDSRISTWWDLPSFQDWFQNKEEFIQKVDYLAHEALDELGMILHNPEANGNTKMAAIRTALELSGKLGSGKSAVKSDDSDPINNMNKEQLEKYISQRLSILPQKDE